MSVTAQRGDDPKSAIEAAQEKRESIERLADSDLPYARYAERLLKFLDQEAQEIVDD